MTVTVPASVSPLASVKRKGAPTANWSLQPSRTKPRVTLRHAAASPSFTGCSCQPPPRASRYLSTTVAWPDVPGSNREVRRCDGGSQASIFSVPSMPGPQP